VQCRAVARHEGHGDCPARHAFGHPRALELRQRPARDCVHLEGALDALRVRALEATRGHGIDARELGVQRRPAFQGGTGIAGAGNCAGTVYPGTTPVSAVATICGKPLGLARATGSALMGLTITSVLSPGSRLFR